MAGGSANFPGRPFQLYDSTTVTRQETANNRSLVHFEVWIRKLSYSPTWSNGGPAFSSWGYNGTIYQQGDAGSFDFQAAGPWRVRVGDVWVAHNANGTRTITVQVAANYALLGAASYSYNFTLPTIARNPPPAPTPIGLDQVTKTSMRYRFSGNGDGGSPIIRWEIQYSRDDAFPSGTPLVTSSGTSTVTGLVPGSEYFFRSRGVNAAGAGAWSAVISARTLSGAYISDGTQWLPADVLISDGTQWLPGDALISDGTSWKQPG